MVSCEGDRVTVFYCSRGHENPQDHRFCRLCGEALMTSTPAASLGLLGGRYQVLRQLGQGGFGRTYLAEDTNRFRELCVLKEFAPQVQGTEALNKAEELFQREAGVLYRLEHPQIPRFREIFRADIGGGQLFLVQDYVEGETYLALLRHRQQQGQCFSEAEVLTLLRQLLPVLAYLHSLGIVHRDLSPDNLICRRSDGLPVLIDFGGVKQIAATVISQTPGAVLPSNPTVLGKVGYAPPEQMGNGEAYPHSDLYALAMTLLVLLTGREPQELLGRDRSSWQSWVNLSPKLQNVLERMLSSAPDQRYPSATTVMQALGLEMSGTPPGERLHLPSWQVEATATLTAPTPVSAPRSALKRLGLRLLSIGVLLTGVAVGIWYAGDRAVKRPPAVAPTPETPTDSESANNIPPEPAFSAEEQKRKAALIQEQEALGVPPQFLTTLVNQEFYAKNPIGRSLTRKPEDAAHRKEWDEIAAAYLKRLARLSKPARSRLGSYTKTDLEKRRIEVNKLNLSSRALNDLTDAQFIHLMPEQPRQGRRSDSMEQLWQAIATDQLADLKAGKTLKRLQFAPGKTSLQTTGRLQPGTGQAYLIDLRKDQTVQLNLQAPEKGVLLSFYPPTSQHPPLLEDSANTEWAGQLSSAGLYEVVVVADSTETSDYALEVIAEPIPPTSPSPTTDNPIDSNSPHEEEISLTKKE